MTLLNTGNTEVVWFNYLVKMFLTPSELTLNTLSTSLYHISISALSAISARQAGPGQVCF